MPDDLYKAVRPMLAVSRGRLICMSTPRGKRGFFYEAWARGGADWHRIEIPAQLVSRIDPEYLAQERRALSESTFRQEFECSFESVEGLVFPGLPGCVVAELPRELATAFARGVRGAGDLQRVGGIDFGYRNPFAAVWGILDGDGVLWLCGEHYDRQKPLSYHAAQLPRQVTWYADPAGASERAELRCGGFTVRQGNNAIQNGIGAVNARIQHGRLKIVAGKCPISWLRRDCTATATSRQTRAAKNRWTATTMLWPHCAIWSRPLTRGRWPATPAGPSSLRRRSPTPGCALTMKSYGRAFDAVFSTPKGNAVNDFQ